MIGCKKFFQSSYNKYTIKIYDRFFVFFQLFFGQFVYNLAMKI